MTTVAFALTAGSFGDFTALISIVAKLAITIYDVARSSKDYKDLMEELRSTLKVLCSMHKDNSSSESEEYAEQAKQLRKEIKTVVTKCEDALLKFLTDYPEPSKIGSKFGWVFSGSNEAATLRRKLDAYKFELQILDDRLSMLMMEAKTMRHISQAADKVIFVDATGNRIPIPLSECAKHFGRFIDAIWLYHSTQKPPGMDFINKEAYSLVYYEEKLGQHRHVDARKWTYIIKNGLTIEMAVLVGRYTNTRKCPKCLGPARERGGNEWECSKCGSEYEDALGGPDMEIYSPAVASSRDRAKRSIPSLITVEEDDLGAFRRITFVEVVRVCTSVTILMFWTSYTLADDGMTVFVG